MRLSPMSSRTCLVGLSLLLGTGSCGDAEVSEATRLAIPSFPRDRRERLAADAASARELAERIDAAGNDELILGDVEKLIASVEDPLWAQFPGWAFRKNSLNAYRVLSLPAKGRGETPLGIDFEIANHPVTLIRTYADLLREHGIELLVVPVPHRLQVYGDQLPGLQRQDDFPGANAVFAKLLVALAEAGVEVVDLLPAFVEARHADSSETDELLFFRVNPHWTPRGVALAADLIAARVRAFDWFEPGGARLGEPLEIHHESGVHALLGPTPGKREQVTVWYQKVLTEGGALADSEDRQSPILLMGDSFAGYYQREGCDLCRQLHARLGLRLDSINSAGFGGTTIWKAVQRRGDGLAGKRLVLWVFRFSLLCYPGGSVIDPFP